MPSPDSEENERVYWPPPTWTSKEKKGDPLPAADPPILKRVKLPERVTIGYLAQITGQELHIIVEQLIRLRLYLGCRGQDFESAARLLRKYGIGAEKEDEEEI
jgi:hypothetical protein